MEKLSVRDYVRPPILKFQIVENTKDYKKYNIKTDNLSNKKQEGYDLFTNYLNSFIFCSPNLEIKMPKKNI